MRVVKTDWMHHDGDQILSLDIDANGVRIATAGRGDASGKICIWDMKIIKKILDNRCSLDKSVNLAKLSELEEHTGCVNSIRWSKNGQLLASGGDDCNVIIWSMKKMKAYTSDDFIKKREMWKPLHVLQGHTGDVLDVAWSYCEKFLASASIDNLICIWDAKNFPCMLKKLSGHQSFVKGLSWDPVGEFLASQSEDKTIMIWPTLSFEGNDNNLSITPTAVIKKPFKKATSLTQFLRLAWSTDGQYILSAHASNNTAPVAKIIERGSWACNKDCVGHRSAICSVSFNPNIYMNSETESNEINVMCALGSRDGTLSLWKFPQKRPFCVLHNLFISAIADMSWSSTGDILLLTSIEGNLSFITFDLERDNLQNAMTTQQIREYHKKLYGLNIQTAYQIPNIPLTHEFLQNEKLNNREKNFFQENTDNVSTILKTNIIKNTEHDGVNEELKHNNDCITKDKPTLVQKQKEIILKDGRKRITPILIAAPIDESPTSNNKHDFDGKVNDSLSISVRKKPKRKSVHFEDNETNNGSDLKKSDNIDPYRSAAVIGIFSKRSFKNPIQSPPIPTVHEFMCEKDGLTYCFTVKNEAKNIEPKTYELRCMRNDNHFWNTYFTGRVVFTYHNRSMIVCTTEDNRLHIFNYTGWRIFPQIVLADSIIGIFVSLEKYLCVVTIFGEILIWDIDEKKIIFKNVYIPMDNIIKDQISYKYVKSVDIHHESIQPIVILSDYTTYLYNKQLEAWLPIVDKLCCFSGCYPSLLTNISRDAGEFQITDIQKLYFSKNHDYNMDEHSNEAIQGAISFLLNQLDIFVTLKMKQQFIDTFNLLIQFLTRHNMDQLIMAICEHLSKESLNSTDIVYNNIGYTSGNLLESLLHIIKSNIRMQDIYIKFKDLVQ